MAEPNKIRHNLSYKLMVLKFRNHNYLCLHLELNLAIKKYSTQALSSFQPCLAAIEGRKFVNIFYCLLNEICIITALCIMHSINIRNIKVRKTDMFIIVDRNSLEIISGLLLVHLIVTGRTIVKQDGFV